MKLILDGEPIAQIRMKYSGRHGIGRIYDPREKQKRDLKLLIGQKYDGEPFEHPRVSFIFHMPIPKSTPKKLLPLYLSGLLKHEKKPDTDNFIKLYLDCMDGITFLGDQKVMLGPCIKLYHPYPKTIIIMNETTEILSPLEVDPLTWFALYGKESGKCSYVEMNSLDGSYTPDRLIPALSYDSSYPRQTIDTLERVPLVPQILAQANLVSSSNPHHLDF